MYLIYAWALKADGNFHHFTYQYIRSVIKSVYPRIHHHTPLLLRGEVLTNLPVSAAVDKDKPREVNCWVREW
jgi:hypothetical protein